jgi:mevalonate kinase
MAANELLEKALGAKLPVALRSSTSTIPQGAGLGSSAAFSVCLARCLAALRFVPELNVFAMAKQIDDYFHAGSSGMDVFACFSGGGCSYSAADGFKRLTSSEFGCIKRFRYSLVDTGERRELRLQKRLIDQQKLVLFYPQARQIVEVFEEALRRDSLDLSVMVECCNVGLFRLVMAVVLIAFDLGIPRSAQEPWSLYSVD